MDILPFVIIFVVAAFFITDVIQSAINGWKGVDDRTPEQKLMDTRISDRITRFGSVLDSINAQARDQKPKTRF